MLIDDSCVLQIFYSWLVTVIFGFSSLGDCNSEIFGNRRRIAHSRNSLSLNGQISKGAHGEDVKR
jgi:hypothetical protein